MISPGTYTELRSKNFDHFIEKRIDEAIAGHASYQSHGAITIATQLFPNTTNADLERVLAKYRSKGWAAEVVSDSRDGDYIKLELP